MASQSLGSNRGDPTYVEVHYVRGNVHQTISYTTYLSPVNAAQFIQNECRIGDIYRFAAYGESIIILIPADTVLSITVRENRALS